MSRFRVQGMRRYRGEFETYPLSDLQPFEEEVSVRDVVFPIKTWRGTYPFTLKAGPIYQCPCDVKCISLAEEIQGPQFWDNLEIEDFGIPDDGSEVYRILHKVIWAMARGDKLYVGCRGGIGRTGLFLSLVYKVLCQQDSTVRMSPVLWVRDNYLRNAVETFEQADYVRDFDPTQLSATVTLAKLWASTKALVSR